MTLFLSDLHLGNRRCKAKELIAFLSGERYGKRLFLVGDVFDDVAMHRWPRPHLVVVEMLLYWFPEIIYLPGNHDAAMRSLMGLNGRIKILDETVYYSSDNRRYLVTHGDKYDRSLMFVFGPHWLRDAGSKLFDGFHTKSSHKSLMHGGTADARFRGLDGVICGHSHYPVKMQHDGIEYLNCGDWLKHCTALVDMGDGIKLIGRRQEDLSANASRGSGTVSE